MSISVILYAIAMLVFLLAAFGATLGEVALIPLGLALIAAGLVASAIGVGGVDLGRRSMRGR